MTDVGNSPAGHDPLAIPYREREQSVTMERMGEPDAPVYGTEIEEQTELFTINIGPHHPATHGVLRLLTTLEGEIVRDVVPITSAKLPATTSRPEAGLDQRSDVLTVSTWACPARCS